MAVEELQTITQVTRTFGVSTRMLRYYEQIGLIESRRIEGYAYRAYDAAALRRLSQILVLRRLRIPLKQMKQLFADENASSAIRIFMESMAELDGEIAALTTIRGVLRQLVEQLRPEGIGTWEIDADQLRALTRELAPARIMWRGEDAMDELRQANETLDRLTERDVRVVYLPPSAVAAYRYVGDEPETRVNRVIDGFVRESNLDRIKPDLRHFGFNAPNPVDDTGFHGYEMWVTVPEDMEVPPPLTKKHMAGGLYAARAIPFGMFDEWQRLGQWVKQSERYAYNGSWDPGDMFGWLEEHLNYVNHVRLENTEPEGFQLDLLMPIREKTDVDAAPGDPAQD